MAVNYQTKGVKHRNFGPKAAALAAFIGIDHRKQYGRELEVMNNQVSLANLDDEIDERGSQRFRLQVKGAYLGGGWMYYSDYPVCENDTKGVSLRSSSAKLKSKSGAPAAPQPYSLQVLAFNLSNYHAWEDKGCRVFGVDKKNSNDHPLEWVVKRLNMSTSSINIDKEEADRYHKIHHPYTRYYLENFNEKALERLASEKLGIFNTVMKGGKPKIPSLKPKPSRGQLLLTQVTDGSKTIYYESGEMAIVSSFHGDKGYYTFVYDWEPSTKLLAVFLPSGTGVCYNHTNQTSLLVSSDGGVTRIGEEDEERWKWPSDNAKLNSPVNIQLNSYMNIKILSKRSINLTFHSGNHTIKIPLGALEGSLPAPPSELQLLKMADQVTYTSQAAQELLLKAKQLRSSLIDKQSSLYNSKRVKSRDVRTPKKEEPGSASVEFIDSASQDSIRVDRELSRLQTRAKNIVDEWMDTYRVALGIASPQLKTLKDTYVRTRTVPSAKSMPPKSQDDNADELATTPVPSIGSANQISRVPSAPSDNNDKKAFHDWNPWPDGGATDQTTPRLSSRERSPSNTLYKSVQLSSMSIRLPQQVTNRKYTPLNNSPPDTRYLTSDWTLVKHFQCPVTLKKQMLGHAVDSSGICKCQRRQVTYITDVELDTFVRRVVPTRQFIVVSIVSSVFPERSHGGSMLDRLHAERNANRAHVCMQARNDPYRVFRYDVATSYFDTDESEPLLLTRHNAIPGMFLIYQGGKLIFCDHIFNGYGNAKKDFEKQLVACRQLANRGFCLPNDFKFTPQTGKHGPRSPWGGQIGGAGVDKHGGSGVSIKMPFIDSNRGDSTPDSVSTLEYQIGRNMEHVDTYTANVLIRKLSTRYQTVAMSSPARIIGIEP